MDCVSVIALANVKQIWHFFFINMKFRKLQTRFKIRIYMKRGLGDYNSGPKAAEVFIFHHIHLLVPLQLTHCQSQLWCQNIWDFKLRAKPCQKGSREPFKINKCCWLVPIVFSSVRHLSCLLPMSRWNKINGIKVFKSVYGFALGYNVC